MTEVFERLHDEHRIIEKLLLVLEQELAVFDRRERPDYEILQAVVRFFEDYSASGHDVKERIVFDVLKARDPEAGAMIGGLETEHGQDAYRLQRLEHVLTGILTDHDVPRQALDDAVHDFIRHARYQIDFEERVLFPAALKALRPEDWAGIEAQLSDGRRLSSNAATQERFRVLSECILQWEQAEQAARA
jgi:hemerythrin-like domain-containing protein